MIGDIGEKTLRNTPLLTGNRLARRTCGLLMRDTDIDSRRATHAREGKVSISRGLAMLTRNNIVHCTSMGVTPRCDSISLPIETFKDIRLSSHNELTRNVQ